jgi:hypothetical protein
MQTDASSPMRTVPIVLLVVLQIIVTPILAAHAIPYFFLDGQRLVVGLGPAPARRPGRGRGRPRAVRRARSAVPGG